MTGAVPIGIAVVERDGRFLVGVRPEGTPLAGCAEFPGGKCEPGEESQASAVRECLEETGLAVAPVRLLDAIEWTYPHGSVELHFWLCRECDTAGTPRPPFRWVERDGLSRLRFPEANAAVVRRLSDA
jgi:8-oxo-dGTP diphosphatase